MADSVTRTYVGPLARGHLLVGDVRIPFERGTAVQVPSGMAKQIDADPEWSDGKKSPKPQGPKPDTQES